MGRDREVGYLVWLRRGVFFGLLFEVLLFRTHLFFKEGSTLGTALTGFPHLKVWRLGLDSLVFRGLEAFE